MFLKFFSLQKIFCILCCNFPSNKPILDFLDIFLCRFVTRRRLNRLKDTNLQSEATHKQKNSVRIVLQIVSFFVVPSPARLPAVGLLNK